MNHRALLLLIQVAVDNWRGCSEYVRRELLSGIFSLCDCLIEDIQGREDHEDHARALTELSLMQDFAESGLTDHDLEAAYREIANCLPRLSQLPEEPE